jgi:1-phosphatidylinositol-3-phosphate 5-kinase
MLSSFWSWGSSSRNKPMEELTEEDIELTSENEDEIANRLLTQFPAYGTNTPNMANWIAPDDNGEENDIHDNEWVFGASSNKKLNISNQHGKSSNDLKSNWDPQEETLWMGSSLSADAVARRENKTDLDTSLQGDQEYWMPDQLCKQCYCCGLPFTVFRRRHHCRLCGQVFCSTCSAYFVMTEDSKTSRACRECFEQFPQKVDDVVEVGVSSSEVLDTQPHLPKHKEEPWLDPMTEFVENEITISKVNSIVKAEAKPDTFQINADAAVVKPNAMSNLGSTATTYLQRMSKALMASDAPILWKTLNKAQRERWINQLLTLATKCCATVDPNVKKGDSLDIRPYVKIKSIAGGDVSDCAYMSGVIFRKTVAHKRMAKALVHPRILLLSGGIEFTRTENRFASLEILFEQEDKYTEILVGKILKVQPDLVIVGRSVSRKAQELLLKADVVLLQHVKARMMQRIARQTGATIISSTDHVMNQFGPKVLGKCHRFRLVSFRDNEIWMDKEFTEKVKRPVKSIPTLLREKDLPNHQRQAALAAQILGEAVFDGCQAVKTGLAKRGVALSYALLEGCPKNLGCTVVLRGASSDALKQVKRVLRFIVSISYSLRLEISYLRERYARIPTSFRLEPRHMFSSSLCVDFGNPPTGRKSRPWNGGSQQEASISGELTAMDHQSILVTSIWMTEKNQCCPAEVKGICYYSLQDVALGQFLRDSCFNLSLTCQNPNCKKSVLDHTLSFVHNDGVINITVEQMDEPLPPSPFQGIVRGNDEKDKTGIKGENEKEDSPIATWTYSMSCKKVVTPLVYISEDTWKMSFGKFLEIGFYNRDARLNAPEHGCNCPLQSDAVLFFGCGSLAARFTYEGIKPYGVHVSRQLPMDDEWHRVEATKQLEQISVASSDLFVQFDKHIEKVSREARLLFGSAVHRPEHLQTVLSELNMIGSEVDHAAKTLQEKIASVSDKCQANDGIVQEAFYRFPWYSRRYLFMLTSAWNDRLSAAGQALSAMRKLADSRFAGRGEIVGQGSGDGTTEDLMEGMRRLRMLNEMYSKYNVTDISTMLPTLPGAHHVDDDDDFEDPESSVDFGEASIDADVLASRRRLYSAKRSDSITVNTGRDTNARPRKQLGARSLDSFALDVKGRQHDIASSSTMKNKAVTPGGAMKSALTRFFNRAGKETDPYAVDLGIFKEGRPRLEPGVDGIVILVFDEIPSTIIAYSLSSSEYNKQFAYFSKAENKSSSDDAAIPSLPGIKSSNPSVGGADTSQIKSVDREGASSSQNLAMMDSTDERKEIERRMLERSKSHIKHTFRDFDEKGQQSCKFVVTTYWATQFHAVRQVFLTQKEGQASSLDVEKSYIQSLSAAHSWAASGGKSGASFHRTADQRFIIKCISRTELQMFLDCAPAYFEYLSKAFFHGLPTVLCKIVGVYQIGYHNRVTGKRSMDQVAIMQNIFYDRKISKTFDLKGSLRGRFARQMQPSHPKDGDASDVHASTLKRLETTSDDEEEIAVNHNPTLLDGDFLEYTNGRPLPLSDRAKAVFQMSILNDTLFLSIINVLDYSILVGVDEENMELVVGIIDFMRQYDIMKQMERVGKSLPMVVGSEAPTIIQPPLYKARFINAMERYFMTVPSKWTSV